MAGRPDLSFVLSFSAIKLYCRSAISFYVAAAVVAAAAVVLCSDPLPVGLFCSGLLWSVIDGLLLHWDLSLDLLGFGLAPVRMLAFFFFVCFMYLVYFCQATPLNGCAYKKLTLVIPPTSVWCCYSVSQLFWCMSCCSLTCYVRCNLLCSIFLLL